MPIVSGSVSSGTTLGNVSTVSGTPTAGNIISATSATAAAWGNGFVNLFDSTLGAPAANIDSGAGGFSTAYSALLILIQARTNTAGVSVDASMIFNNDSAANYDRNRLQVVNTTVTGASAVAQSAVNFILTGNTATANVAGAARIFIPNYASTTFFKNGEITSASPDETAANSILNVIGFNWRSTSAITRVKLAASDAANLLAGTRMTIYGLP